MSGGGGSPLLRVEGLRSWFPIRRGLLRKTVGHVQAVTNVDLEILPGSTLALVGESGCGKTTVGRSILRLTPAQSGRVLFDGVDLLSLSRRALIPYRRQLQIVFQDPMASLDPRMRVRDAVAEGMRSFRIGANETERTKRVARLLERVQLDPDQMWRYPHEFSGGQRQRICIARALAVEPRLIICDEAVSALDVSIQAQILNLLGDLQRDLGLAYLFITHDLGVVRYLAQRVAVDVAHVLADAAAVRLADAGAVALAHDARPLRAAPAVHRAGARGRAVLPDGGRRHVPQLLREHGRAFVRAHHESADEHAVDQPVACAQRLANHKPHALPVLGLVQ